MWYDCWFTGFNRFGGVTIDFDGYVEVSHHR